ncbi:MAG: hypothetical protein LAP61_16130 [Acidobacteriia bacterium]|nr:hypothetical protein [Terriglobia bacterium]
MSDSAIITLLIIIAAVLFLARWSPIWNDVVRGAVRFLVIVLGVLFGILAVPAIVYAAVKFVKSAWEN